MVQLGYALSSEEHTPNDLVRYARRAEEVGFSFAFISDHYHPWIDRQGQSSFVWGVLGAIAQATERLPVGTGVTCPIMRIHPAIIAQAAATMACLLPGRFFLGVGSGELLNEHILGQHWPEPEVRQEMLGEAVAIIRDLWRGDYYSHHGPYFTVENARLYTLPDQPPPIFMAAGGPASAEVAGRIADGFVSTAPERTLVERFDTGGGQGKPRYGQFAACWAATDEETRRTAHTYWPSGALPGELNQELALPRHYEQAAKMVSVEAVAKEVVTGSGPEPFMAKIQEFVDAGYDHVYIHQVGPDQEGFFRFAERELLPRVAQASN